MEAQTVTGAAKTMLEFCRSARDLEQALPPSATIETSIVTFERARASASRAAQTSQQQTVGNAPGRDKSPSEFVEAARALGLEVDIIPERYRFDLRVIPALREIVARRAPDIVLTHHVKSHFLMKLSRLWRQYPWAAFHHGYTTTDWKMRAYNYLDRWSLPTADRVITVCEAFAQELTGDGGVPLERISVQHNSIRPEQAASAEDAQALKKRFAVAEDECIVLAIGRLSSEKAHIDLIHAFRYLLDAHPELKARLVIVGDGPERGRLEAAAGSLGLVERIVFAGQSSDVRPYYRAADALALPSHSEGSPYVLLEAMAAGLPIVGTAVGGVPEMVEDNVSALLVAPRDTRAMAEAIARVLIDPALARKLAANASALVATRYSPETYVRSLVGIYREIISSAARPDIKVT
jgi:glycosyltransferase involved in cell wall biosynthesis